MKEMSRTQIQTRENFLNAFEKVRTEKPLHTISIRDITDAAGYNRSSFYLYFSDIYALSEAAEDRLISELAADAGRMFAGSVDNAPGIFMQRLAESALPRLDRINLFADQASFLSKFLALIRPVFSRVSGIPEEAPDFDFIISLILSTMLHNMRYYSEHEDVSFSHLTDLTHELIAPGLGSFSLRSRSSI